MVEKVLFLGHIFEMEILMDLHIMRSPESTNHVCSISSVCMYVCVCVPAISITQNQFTSESSIFIKIAQKLSVQKHTEEF